MLENIEELKIKADMGDIEAGVRFASCYITAEEEVSEQIEHLVKGYLEKAVDDKNAMAMKLIGDMYSTGRFVEPDNNKAAFWYEKAKENGVEEAVQLLEDLSMGAEDFEERVQRCSKAAEAGDSAGYIGLGDIYLEGRYMERKPEEAFNCYEKAYKLAKQDMYSINYPDACMRLGNVYARGEGVEDSMRMARKYFLEARDGYKALFEMGDTNAVKGQKEAENAILETRNVLCSRCYRGR